MFVIFYIFDATTKGAIKIFLNYEHAKNNICL